MKIIGLKWQNHGITDEQVESESAESIAAPNCISCQFCHVALAAVQGSVAGVGDEGCDCDSLLAAARAEYGPFVNPPVRDPLPNLCPYNLTDGNLIFFADIYTFGLNKKWYTFIPQ